MATNREYEIRTDALNNLLARLKEATNTDDCAKLANAIAALLNTEV